MLDLCANGLGADGIVLDLRHFPRRDPEYLAQLRKFAADLAMTLVAVRDDELATVDASDTMAIAATLGAPYVLSCLPAAGFDAVTVYNAALGRIGAVLTDAKKHNVFPCYSQRSRLARPGRVRA